MYITEINKNKVLKMAGKNTFRFVHEAAGIDFEKPVIYLYGEGPFTLRKIWENLPHLNYDYKVLIIFRRQWKSGLSIVKLLGRDDFTIEVKSRTYFDYKTIPDTICRKSDFNEARKENCVHFYVIAQRNDYTQPEKGRDNSGYGRKAIKDNTRYYIENIAECYENTAMARKYPYRLSLIEEGGTGKKFDWNIYENIPHRYGEKIPVSDIFDKSGYYVCARRAELKRRAENLRAERAKSEYLRTDISHYIPELKAAAEEAKKSFANDVLTASCADEFDELYNKVRTIKNIYWDIERFEKYEKEKCFASVNAAIEYYNKIMQKIGSMNQQEEPAHLTSA